MKDIRVLFVNQEIEPYVVGTRMATLGRELPVQAQEMGLEVRTFMPKFGVINERRNQLHEVIRLSGLNLVIAGADHPLIIKVASEQQKRLQFYFIDNEDYFLRRGIYYDELELPYKDNDQRALFFARGVLETVKKLRWIPDVIHCNGWFTAFVPLLVRTLYSHEPTFSKVKVLYTLYEDRLSEPFGADLASTVESLRIPNGAKELLGQGTHEAVTKVAIQYSDAVGKGSADVSRHLIDYAREQGKELLDVRTKELQRTAYEALYARESVPE